MASNDESECLETIRKRIDATLSQNLMPFWADHAVDREHGGFLTRLDRVGNRLDVSEKILIHQVRLIAAFSMAHLHGLRERDYLALARHGFEFVTQCMWDDANGGFHFSVTRDGQPKLTRKNTDFHAYALIGLSEYFRAFGDASAREWAERVFQVLMSNAADRDFGFIEDFDGQPWPALNDEQMNLGGRQGIKTIDMHTNMLEGLLYLTRATGEAVHRAALKEVLDLIVTHGIDQQHGCTITAFDADWNPIPDGNGRMTTSYGLNVELAWLMLEAVDVLGESREAYRGVIVGLVEHALNFGFDYERGGLAAYGPMTGSVIDAHDLENRLLKTWWAQAELMNALVDLLAWTGDERYRTAFVKVFDWVWKHQIDHECGDWYQETDWFTGAPLTTDKGREWKTAFHAGRALMRSSRRFAGSRA